MVADAPGNLFAESELEAFDAYLREPWAEPGADRPAIPRAVATISRWKRAAAARCAVGRAARGGAHRGRGRLSVHTTITTSSGLCRNCHAPTTRVPFPVRRSSGWQERCVQTVQRRLSGVRPNGWPFAGAPAAAAILVGRDVELGGGGVRADHGRKRPGRGRGRHRQDPAGPVRASRHRGAAAGGLGRGRGGRQP